MAEQTSGKLKTRDLLIELGCEELPPKALDKIREALFDGVCNGLEQNQIEFDAGESRSYSSPRRLALLLRGVAEGQPDQTLDRRGPALSAAFDNDGNPTGAARGFARSVGLEVAELDKLENDKGAWLFARVHKQGQRLADLVYPVLEQAIRQLPVPKPMRWADNDFHFVRPVHWLVVMHGESVLEGGLFGLQAGRKTRGHRIHAPGPHRLEQAGDYLEVLREAHVLADQGARRAVIRERLLEIEPDVLIDPDLLDEVNNLVEWPVPVACSFDETFLEVPHSALIASMQDHQKFFPVRDMANEGAVNNHFIAISNIDSTHPPSVREGYERVIRPRLADARFFFEQDQKEPISAYLPLLDRVVFQEKIGTVGDKSKRMASISRVLAEFIGEDAEECARAARLAKCDLMTQMVGEFPELQGEMGKHYALTSDEGEQVAEAIGEHYAPRFSGDAIPRSAAGQVVGIADRVDTLVGIFAAGLRPSGNKDPFALRRSALGLVRILLEADLDIELDRLLSLGQEAYQDTLDLEPGLVPEIRAFINERLRNFYRDRGYSADLIAAVLVSGWQTLPDLDRRLVAMKGFTGHAAASSLAAANKRIGNILKKSSISDFGEVKESLLHLNEEKKLFGELSVISDCIEPLLEAGDYAASLEALSALRKPVDAFFDAVMVMDENAELRDNRLALLAQLKSRFDRIADLSVLES